MNVEGIGAVLHRLVPQRDRTNSAVHAAVVGLACCGISLNHRIKLILAAAFFKKVLKHGTAREYAKVFVALFHFGFELRELLDVWG